MRKKNRLHRLWVWFIRTFFDLLYGPFARTYDLVAWLVSLGQWKAWGRTALQFVQGDRVLELGHGPGHIQAALAEEGFDSVGLDRSPQMGHIARRRILRKGRSPQLVRAAAQAIPLRSGTFSDVVATFPTEYIVDPKTAREIERVLEPEGRLVVVIGARFTGSDIVSRLLEWIYRITGQREPLPLGDKASWADGRIEIERRWVDAQHSRVLVALGGVTPSETRADGTSGCTSSPAEEARTDLETGEVE